MNCSEFANIVVDLAQSEMRGVLLNVAMKQRGLQHAQSCVPCAARLKMEQALSRSLRAVATGDQSLSAPASVETALLAAFRTREEGAPVRADVLTPTFNESPLQRLFRQMKWALIPALAAAMLLIAFAATRILTPTAPTSSSKESLTADNQATPAPTISVTPNVPEPAPEPQLEARNEVAVRISTGNAPPRSKAAPNYAPPRSRGGRVTVDVGPFELDEPETVSAKDFLVFDYAHNLPPADSMQLMRVRLPRERLAPLGIPLPRETRNENFVNADFLVGSDGVPRAIRVANR
jgi:hypothetical protein